MALKDKDTYYKITDIDYIETDINGKDEIHIYGTLEFYDKRGGELQYKSEQLYIVDKDDFDVNGDIVAQMYKISKLNNMYDKDDVFEEGQGGEIDG